MSPARCRDLPGETAWQDMSGAAKSWPTPASIEESDSRVREQKTADYRGNRIIRERGLAPFLGI